MKLVKLGMIVEKCGKCGEAIDDEKSGSIACDICCRWYHAEKSCSKLKKTLFVNIKAKDQWVCPMCIEFNHSLSSKNIDTLLRNYEEQELTEEAGKNEKELSSLRGLIMDMRTEKTREDRGEWRVVGGRGRGGVCRMSVGGGPLATSNSFEVLGERHNLESLKDFPPLTGKRKGGIKGNVRGESVWGGHVSGGGVDRSGCVLRVVSDSHGRGCGLRLGRSEVGKICFIEDHTKPGDPVMSMVDRAGAVTGKAEASDYLVMVGGTNLVTEESVERLDPRLDALAEGVQGRVVWVETPYRYDLPQHNNLLRKQNEVLKAKCTKYKWAFLGINSLMDRSCYTSHGLHLNWRGKDVLSGVIESYIACVDSLVQQSAYTKKPEGVLKVKPDLNDSVGIDIAIKKQRWEEE
ncbi:hypothetical protein J6590_033432 [Homalodisca vitripennis]|nr:hypothetical protein J6590_033432 [Homalodisca vitripennis]